MSLPGHSSVGLVQHVLEAQISTISLEDGCHSPQPPKSAASQDPHLLSNFRPIALASCVGKLFTSLLKSRWLQFMVANNFLDLSVQKAFLPGIPGCFEQYQKLLLMIAGAHKKHRSLTVCWLDIANAYGSVHHQLITYCLQHYHAPSIFLNTVSNIYSDLSAIITGPTWSTTSVPLRTGVYQGDPLSVVIFNTVMSTLADSLRAHQHLGYTLSGSNVTTNLLLYADDTCLIADGPASCQHLLLQVERCQSEESPVQTSHLQPKHHGRKPWSSSAGSIERCEEHS